MEKELYIWEWYFSHDKENMLYGILRRNESGYKLELKGSFSKKEIYAVISWKTYFSEKRNGIILWKTLERESITLIWLSKFPNDFWDDTFFCEDIIIWKHYETENDILFDKVSFSFDGLAEWLWVGLLWAKEISENDIAIRINKKTLNIELANSNDIVFTWKSEIEGNFKSYDIVSRWTPLRWEKELTVKIKANIHMERKGKKISLYEIKDNLLQVQRFFSLILEREIQFSELAFFENELMTFLWKKAKEILTKRNVIFNQSSPLIVVNNDSDKISRTTLLFWFNEVKNDFTSIFNNWLQNSEKYKTIYNLYFATKLNKWLHLENMFLNVIQALEGLYNASSLKDDYITKEKEQELRKKLKDIKEIAWNDKNKYITIKNDFSLSEKLRKIETYINICFDIDWKDIKEIIVHIRNVFSHGWRLPNYNQRYNDTLSWENLFKIYQLMELALELFIIKELRIWDSLYLDIVKLRKKHFDA